MEYHVINTFYKCWEIDGSFGKTFELYLTIFNIYRLPSKSQRTNPYLFVATIPQGTYKKVHDIEIIIIQRVYLRILKMSKSGSEFSLNDFYFNIFNVFICVYIYIYEYT